MGVTVPCSGRDENTSEDGEAHESLAVGLPQNLSVVPQMVPRDHLPTSQGTLLEWGEQIPGKG